MMTVMTDSPETTRQSMVPSWIVALMITGALLGVASAIFTLNVATTGCSGMCDPNVHYTIVNVHTYLTWAIFVGAAIMSFLLRNRRWWLAILAGAVVLDVVLALVLRTLAS